MMKSNESLLTIKVKGKEENLIRFVDPITMEDYYLSMEDIERAMALKDEYIFPVHHVRTIVSLKNGYWYCKETEKVYQLTEVNND